MRNVLNRLYECQRENGEADVRIGVQGGGIAPNYRTEYSIIDGSSVGVTVIGAFGGLGHKPLANQDLLRDEHWSSNKMSLAEVASLLGGLRNFKAGKIAKAKPKSPKAGTPKPVPKAAKKWQNHH